MNATNAPAPVATVNGVFLFRKGKGLELRGTIREGRAHFAGGKFGGHSVSYDGPADAERVLTHWEGYCDANGIGINLGTVVTFTASNLPRHCKVIAVPSPTAATVMVSGFRYKHGGQAAPRRMPKHHVRIVN